MKRKGCIRKRKKERKKVFKKMTPLIGGFISTFLLLKCKVDQVNFEIRYLIKQLSPYSLREPITRCDRLLTFKN